MQLQHLPENKEQADAADYLYWITNVNKVTQIRLWPTKQGIHEAYFLPGLCAVIGGASWTRAACRTTEGEGVV